ncbi:MAG: DUF120 domain-containing protein [Candidatus Aenigmarchaeota archaeon]|nr:DUF120 domain-containing protein [Candidatus Aenigmarchaeota archaeon]
MADDELERYKRAVLKGEENKEPAKKEEERKEEISEEPKTEEKHEEEQNEKKGVDKLPVQRALSEQIPIEMSKEQERIAVRLRGKVISGTGRGKELVERYEPRLRHILGCKPFPGTLNVKLEKAVRIEDIEERRVQHVLFDGRVWIDARLAKARLYFRNFIEECWIIHEEVGIQEEDVAELIDDDNLQEKTGMKIGDEVELEVFVKTKEDNYEKFKTKLRRFIPKSKRIIRV